MSTLSNISPATNDDALQSQDDAATLPNQQGGMAGLFEELMALALSPPSNEHVTLNQKNHLSASDGKDTKPTNTDSGNLTNQASSQDKLKNALGLLASVESGSTVSGKPIAKSIDGGTGDSQDQTRTLTVNISDLEIIAEQMLAATVPNVNLPAKAIRPIAPDESPAPSPADATVKPVSILAASAQAKQISDEVGRISGSDLSENQTTPAAQSLTVPKAGSLAAELNVKDPEASTQADAAAIDSSKAKLNFESNDPSSKDSDPGSTPAAPPPPETSGTSIAKQDVAMKQAEKENKIAEQTEKVLPGNVVSISSGTSSQLFSPRAAEFSAANTANISVSPSSNLDAVAALPVDSTIVPMSPTPDTRLLERTQDMVTLNAMRLTDSGNNSMQVVIKPDAGTQLSLELRQHNGGVEVQAVLQQGDFNHLNQQWPDLQHRLDQRGIRLAPLDDSAANANNSGSETFQQKQNRTDNTVLEPAFTGMPTGLFAPEPAQASAHRGWETWA